MKNEKKGRRDTVSDVLIISGAGLITAGAAILSAAAGFLVAGVCCVIIGWLTATKGGDC